MGTERQDQVEALLSAVINSLEGGVLVVNQHQEITLWNTWLVEHSGVQSAQAEGKALSTLFPALENSRVVSAIEGALSMGMAAVLSRSLNRSPFPLKSLSGEPLEQMVYVRPMTLPSGDTYALVQILDASSGYRREVKLRQQARETQTLATLYKATVERTQAILDSTAEGIISFTRSGLIETANKAALSMFGLDAAAMLQHKVSNLLTYAGEASDQQQAVDWDQLDILGNGQEFTGHRANGETFIAELSTSSLSVDNNDLFIAVVRDVTASRRAAEELLKAKEAAEAANMAKSDFLATMSHEIRTPMNGVVGMADILLGTELNDKQQRYAQTIRRSADGLVQIINDILDFSKMEAGKLEINASRFDVGDFLDGSLSILRPEAESKGLKLELSRDVNVPTQVVCDAGRLRQILINLLGNAIKFTEKGSVSVHVHVTDEGQQLCFEVSDTGIGIPEASLKTLFEKFTQVDSSVSRQYGGTGLGLAICHRLVNILGGDIGVKSKLGQGSTFWFTVAVGTTADKQGSSRSSEPQIQFEAPTKREVKCLSILVAEDNEINQQVALTMLESAGHRVDIACNGVEALELVQEKAYDMVLMDVQMPGMDGLQATAAIRQLDGDKARIPIIALTANAMRGDEEMCLQAGMDDYIAKPIDRAKLHKVISAWQ